MQATVERDVVQCLIVPSRVAVEQDDTVTQASDLGRRVVQEYHGYGQKLDGLRIGQLITLEELEIQAFEFCVGQLPDSQLFHVSAPLPSSKTLPTFPWFPCAWKAPTPS
ncbi:hypothetical protein D3C81_2098790 [compost metagenome]